MTMFDQMNSSELDAFAAKLHAQINRGPGTKIELKDVKSWIALRENEAESCSEPPFFFLKLI
jgi:hypothetical protein